jgi:hypothetical protein
MAKSTEGQQKAQKKPLDQKKYRTGLVYLRMKSLPVDRQKEFLDKKQEKNQQ